MEEIGSLGYIFACTFGVGAELICDAIILHGTDELNFQVADAAMLLGACRSTMIYATACAVDQKADHSTINTKNGF